MNNERQSPKSKVGAEEASRLYLGRDLSHLGISKGRPKMGPGIESGNIIINAESKRDQTKAVMLKIITVLFQNIMEASTINRYVLRPRLWIGAKLGQFIIVDTRPTQADISNKIVSSWPLSTR